MTKLFTLDTVSILRIILILLILQFLLPLHQVQAQAIEDFSPISHWTCDETSGVRYDSNTVTAINLTDNNTVGSATGLRSNACDFELSNSEYLSFGSATGFPTGASPRTVTAWVNLESLKGTDSYQTILDYGTQTSCTDEIAYVIWENGSGNEYQAIDNFCGRDSSATDLAITTGTWYFLAFTYNGTAIKWYKNGTYIDSDTITLATGGSSNLKIGRRWNDGTTYFDGLIDEISVFPSELSASDITTLYNSGTPLPYEASSSTPTSTPETSTSTSLSQYANDAIILGGISLFIIAMLMVITLVSIYVIWIIRA